MGRNCHNIVGFQGQLRRAGASFNTVNAGGAAEAVPFHEALTPPLPMGARLGS
jgi:hypothetical protein